MGDNRQGVVDEFISLFFSSYFHHKWSCGCHHQTNLTVRDDSHTFIYRHLMCIVATEESGKSDRKSNFAALGQSREERQLKTEREKNVSTASGNNLTDSWHESLNSWEEHDEQINCKVGKAVGNRSSAKM